MKKYLLFIMLSLMAMGAQAQYGYGTRNNPYPYGYPNREAQRWESAPVAPAIGSNYNYSGNWRGGFEPYDVARWQQGRWMQSRHNGVYGWWWIVGGLWYYYSQPVYPYPAMGVPYSVYNYETPTQQYGNTYFYCPGVGYYPYVTYCPRPWQQTIR